MKKGLFDTIISDLRSDDFFSDSKFVRAYNTLILRNRDGFVAVDLQHWRDFEDYDDESETESCAIRPVYGRHFDILNKWFEKFSFKELNDQRYGFDIMRYNISEEEQIVYIKYDFSNYEEKFQKLSSILKSNITEISESYATLNDFYNKIVVPKITGDEDLPDIGADWIFEYLTSGYLLDRENYPALKAKILERVEWMHGWNEPNVEHYYDRMDEIISYMEDNVKL
jgi:hypothetical protein